MDIFNIFIFVSLLGFYLVQFLVTADIYMWLCIHSVAFMQPLVLWIRRLIGCVMPHTRFFGIIFLIWFILQAYQTIYIITKLESLLKNQGVPESQVTESLNMDLNERNIGCGYKVKYNEDDGVLQGLHKRIQQTKFFLMKWKGVSGCFNILKMIIDLIPLSHGIYIHCHDTASESWTVTIHIYIKSNIQWNIWKERTYKRGIKEMIHIWLHLSVQIIWIWLCATSYEVR